MKPFQQIEINDKQLKDLMKEGIVFVRTKYINLLIERVPIMEDKTIR